MIFRCQSSIVSNSCFLNAPFSQEVWRAPISWEHFSKSIPTQDTFIFSCGKPLKQKQNQVYAILLLSLSRLLFEFLLSQWLLSYYKDPLSSPDERKFHSIRAWESTNSNGFGGCIMSTMCILLFCLRLSASLIQISHFRLLLFVLKMICISLWMCLKNHKSLEYYFLSFCPWQRNKYEPNLDDIRRKKGLFAIKTAVCLYM